MEFKYIHNEKTTVYHDGDVPYITFNKLDKCNDKMIHAFSTKLGGVSKDHLSSLNLSFSRGDDPENVMENHRRFAKAVGYDYKNLVFSDQVHKTDIHIVSANDMGKGITRESDIKEIDGLVTNEKNIPIMTFYADCVPLFFYDKEENVIGLAHSGWKGTVSKIGEKMVMKMADEYGSKPENIVVAIGPSICQKCYEVSEDVAKEFEKVFADDISDKLIYAKKNGKYQLNLHEACRITLLNAGILEENLDVTDLCTNCNHDILYSHRFTNGKRGNLAAVMMLKEG